MKLNFNLDYQTVYGEEIVINILSENNPDKATKHKMVTLDGKTWTAQVALAARECAFIDYYYSVEREGMVLRHEWTVVPHRLEQVASKSAKYTCYDHWNDIPDDSYLYSSAFTDCVSSRKTKLSETSNFNRTIRIKVRAPQLRSNEKLVMIGNDPELGAWSVLQPVKMTEHAHNEWVATIDADKLRTTELEFKFVSFDHDDKPYPVWEEGGNRTISLPEIKAGETVVYELAQAYFPMYPWRMAGTVVPIFSLRTRRSFGVGDFGDLKMMIDWVAATNQRALQVLPINDTTITHTWVDSYPYNSISIYALHPQYTDLNQLPPIADEGKRIEFEQLRQELNALPQIDYERVNNAKLEYLHIIFDQEGAQIMKSEAFKAFFEANKHWLVPYAAFCHFRDLYGTATFSQWPDHHTLEAKEIAAMSNPRTKAYKDVSFWYFVQFNLDNQMHAAHEYARSKQVILKGDIPIGISRDGVEAWVEPKYFNLNGQAGAPPDAFSTNGQNWGFPTYNWDTMIADGCSWWVKRFRKMSQFFDAYRIDHVLGFFRIWEIPINAVHGLLGQFSPSLGMSRGEIEGYGL
ncbi:MAG: 4-alpha-glucanotransferase, partial [Muribaculaceae bacterium]|nr:4-alpha-glucanotransferase [Muribaculaceae bacterium]